MKRLLRQIFARETHPDAPCVVTFTGGMGAQILSAAIYFHMKQAGQPVYADLSYFQQPERLAVVGNAGACTHWGWQLSPFGLEQDTFETNSALSRRNARVIADGVEKLELALKALADPQVQEVFSIPVDRSDIAIPELEEDYLCIHVRRGDYVNVASHLIGDQEFVALAARFSGLLKSVVILSDSPISEFLKKDVSQLFERAAFLDNTDAFVAHRIMRGARILVCSNSQFSLIAAMLNPKALLVIPKQWFGEELRALEAPLGALCRFQLI